jgi:hypothetical protein
MNNRKVGFNVLLRLIRSKGPIPTMGLIFTVLSIFVLLPIVIAISIILRNPYAKSDPDNIKLHGTEKDATITMIKIIANTTVNNAHPVIITYSYNEGIQAISDKFEALVDYDKIENLKIGDKIGVIAYEGQSIIKDLEPYSFPVALFYILPGMFFIIGSILLLTALTPALRIYSLYKTGIIKDAQVVSMAIENSNLLMGGRQNLMVDYFYNDAYGNQTIGEAKTDDILLLHEKKSGDTIKIFVSKDDQQSCIVPRLLALKYNWTI